MNYKESNYNVVFDHNNAKYIYNTFSGALANLQDNSLFAMIQNPPSSSADDVPNNMLRLIEEGGFIVPADVDELSEIRCKLNRSKNTTTRLEYSICLSYQCNLSCPYCFEKTWEKNKSSPAIDNAVEEHLIRRVSEPNTKSLRVNWSGGEPLLFIDRISAINKSIRKCCLDRDIKYTSKLTTNMTTIPKGLPEILQTSKIDEMQVTLDGYKNIHDKYRISDAYPETYDLILANIVKIRKLEHCPKIVVRVNISKESLPTIPDLLTDMEQHGLKNKVRIAFSRLRAEKSKSFTLEEYSRHEITLYKHLKNKGWKVNIRRKLRPRGVGCGAYTKRSYAIMPDLSVLKCWEMASTSKHVIGHIEKDGKLVVNRKECIALALDPLDIQICKNCFCLPLCMGGCAVDRTKTACIEQSDMKLGRNCSPLKYNLVDMLKLYIDVQQRNA